MALEGLTSLQESKSRSSEEEGEGEGMAAAINTRLRPTETPVELADADTGADCEAPEGEFVPVVAALVRVSVA